jgi:hypothetical protein
MNYELSPFVSFVSFVGEQESSLRTKISSANMSKTRVLPKAFTEKGLYM